MAALWTFSRILGPIVAGLRSAIAASSARGAQGHVLPLVERDLPIKIVGAVVAVALALIALLLWQFIAGGALAGHAPVLIAATLLFVLVAGVVIASITGYMAGLIGASNSPVSGVGILGVIAAALMLLAVLGRSADSEQSSAMVAYALFATGIVFGIATISNDNLQDLKTGQLVGATPWRQQVALVFGVIFGALIIPPVLGLLNTAYGFAGTPGSGTQRARRAAGGADLGAGARYARWPSEPAHDRVRALARRLDHRGRCAAWAARGACGCRRSRSDLASICPMGATLPVVIGALTG